MHAEALSELAEAIRRTLSRHDVHLSFPIEIRILEEFEDPINLEFDRCSFCREVDERDGDWYDDLCPGCADEEFGDDDDEDE